MNLQKSHSNFEIDLMCWSDLDQVLSLESQSFATPWTRMSFELSVNNPDVDALVIRKEGVVAAYLIASERGGEYLIANVAVVKQYRRQGLATDLVTQALVMAEGRGVSHAVLEVRESNHGAISLYERLGFQYVQKNPDYYSSPREDALVMAVRL